MSIREFINQKRNTGVIMERYRIFGLMSGTSLDGLDIACCDFWKDKTKDKWKYKLEASSTIDYDEYWKSRLSKSSSLSGLELSLLDKELGAYFGKLAKRFSSEKNLIPNFIASHGHTVFHQPEQKLTLQIGDGYQLMQNSGITVINDFRSLDVALGGQGAPLVPIGDKLLFEDCDFCINLGGIANISWDDQQGSRRAFDICPVNMILNLLAKRKNLEYDESGKIAKTGKIIPNLLENLNKLDYYQKEFPKSLGVEWFNEHVLGLFEDKAYNTEDYLRTAVEHISMQISITLNNLFTSKKIKESKVLFTGGGTFNSFLIEKIRERSNKSILFEIPSEAIINFKEAVIFAFLGLLRYLEMPNVLSSVTSASYDSCGGTIYAYDRIMKK